MMMSKQPISKENLEFNSRLLNLLMSEIANFVKTFDFRDIPYINFAHFLSEILENESEINDSVILSISNKLNSYIKDHILSLGEDLDIKEFFNQRGIHINKEYVNCNNDLKFDRYYIIDVRFIYKGSLLVNKVKYDNFVTDTFPVRYKELVINCFGVIVRKYDIICTETLKVKNMVKNKRLSKSLHDASFGMFIEFLSYKCEWYKKTLSKIDTFFPSSKTCSCCGSVKKDLTLNIREWVCEECGVVHDRDINASINILNEGLRLLQIV